MGVCHAQSKNKAEIIYSESVGIVQRPTAARFPLMNGKLIRLAERREYLVTQAAIQRKALAQNFEPWRMPLALAVLRFIKNYPAAWIVGVVLLAALRPGRIGKWLRRGWIMWQIMHKLRGR